LEEKMPEEVMSKSQGTPEVLPKPSLSSQLIKILSRAERAGAILSGVFILVMMVMTTLDVILRDFFNSPIRGNTELQTILIVGVVYLAAASVQARRGHITLDLITSHLSKINQLALYFFNDFIMLIFGAIVCWQFALATRTAWITHDYFWGVVKFPLWPPYLMITLGMGLLGLRLVVQLISSPLWHKTSGLSFLSRSIRVFIVALVGIFILAGILISINAHLQMVTVGLIACGLFVILLFLGVPVFACLGLITIIGFWIMVGGESALGIAGTIPFSAIGQYTLTVMPLFLIMGTFAALAGFAEEGFKLAKHWLEGIPGGIIHATIVGATAFGAATGSGGASCVVLAKVAIPEMLKQGIKKGMAIGVVASASTLAIMIPPSSAFVLYAMLTGNSVGKLLIAGIIPGLIGAVMIGIMVAIRCKIDPSQYGYGRNSTERTPWKTRFAMIPRAWGLLFIALVIVGGLYTGIFTPTESGAIGAFAACLAVMVTRKGGWRGIGQALLEAGEVTGQFLLIIMAGLMFSYLLSVTGLPATLTNAIVSTQVAPIVVIIIIIFVYITLGTFMDDISIMVATIPIIYPMIVQLGFSPIWFGVLMVQNIEIGVLTPPYGMNLFILKAMLPNTSMGEIFKGVMWFIVPVVLTMVIYIAFPDVALWLPEMMK
jgi:C4-dicarboxylate transporter, DctM subunit